MATFSNLPDETVLQIIQYLPNDYLLPLATVSKKLHRCFIQQFYRYVHCWEPPDRLTSPEYNWRFPPPDWTNKHLHLSGQAQGPGLPWDTRIHRLPLFLRTIRESEALRYLVVGASFACRPQQEGTVLQITRLLTPTLLHLQFKRMFSTYNQNSEYLSAVSSLEIRISLSGDLELSTNDFRNEADKEKICSLFDLPKVTLLSLSGVRNWKLLVQGSDIVRSGTSGVTCLVLTDTVPVDRGLAEILSWPKSLKSLHYELQLSLIHRGFFGPVGPDEACLSAKAFSAALTTQEQHLEEISIYGHVSGGRSGFEPEETIDLHSFSRLQYVGLALTFLLITAKQAKTRNISAHIPSISEILPASLKELRIQMEDEISCSEYFSGESIDDTDLAPEELSEFVCEIIHQKDSRFAQLRSIMFWQQESVRTRVIYDLKGDAYCKEVVGACKAANIELSWVIDEEPPLFSSSP